MSRETKGQGQWTRMTGWHDESQERQDSGESRVSQLLCTFGRTTTVRPKKTNPTQNYGSPVSIRLCLALAAILTLLTLLVNFIRVDAQPNTSLRSATLETSSLQKVPIRHPKSQLSPALSTLRRSISLCRQRTLDSCLWLVARSCLFHHRNHPLFGPLWRKCIWTGCTWTFVLPPLALWAICRA